MAVAAAVGQSSNRLIDNSPELILGADNYVFVDDLLEIGIARQQERHRAQNIIENKYGQYQTGDRELISVDALSTAENTIMQLEKHGEHSSQYTETLEGLRLDCQRLVGEWYRKKTWEYFPIVRHDYNERTGEYYSHGLSISQMTENALVPMPHDPEEQERRVNERVEEVTPRILRSIGGAAIAGATLRTISECTDKAEKEYQEDLSLGGRQRSYNGYVPEINKLMIRDISLDDSTGDRYEEQVGLPGTYITHEIIQDALSRKGVEAGNMDKTDLHGNQILAGDDILDFVRHLDDVASEQWCTNIFMGEEVDKNYVKDYTNVRSEALSRQKMLESHSNMVADYVIGLAESQTNKMLAPKLVEEFVKKMLLNIAKNDESVGVQIFNEETAVGLREVVRLEGAGRMQEAATLMLEVDKAAPSGGYCGAGSCGLEYLDPKSSDISDIKKLGFNEKDTIKDTERKCKCGSKTIYYDLKKAEKGCTSCGETAKY